MIPDALLPAAIVLTSLVPGLLIFLLAEESHVLRTALNMAGALAKLALVGWLILGVYEGRVFESRLTLGLDPNGGNRFFRGELDDVRVWDRALTAEEVDALHRLGTPADNPLPPDGARQSSKF